MEDDGGERSSFVAGLIENRAKEVRTASPSSRFRQNLRFDLSPLRVSTIGASIFFSGIEGD